MAGSVSRAGGPGPAAGTDPRSGDDLAAPDASPPAALSWTVGISGLVFAALSLTGLTLIRQAPGLGVPDGVYTTFYAGTASSVLVTTGLHVVPFAGIAFLWHMVSTRTLVLAAPSAPPELPRWLQLAAGVVFVSMTFVGSAAVGAVALLKVFSADPLPSVDVARAFAAAGYGMVFVYGVRAAGMYMIATSSMMRHVGVLPRWAAWLSYLAAIGLLASTTFHPAILLVFPVWVALLSALVLFRAVRSSRTGPVPGDKGSAGP